MVPTWARAVVERRMRVKSGRGEYFTAIALTVLFYLMVFFNATAGSCDGRELIRARARRMTTNAVLYGQ